MYGELAPYQTWSTGRVFSDVVPFLAAICKTEKLRQARGRRNAKFLHYLQRYPEEVRELLASYALQRPHCTANGHPLR